MNILITGITGGIGSAVADSLLKNGHHVWGITRRNISLPYPAYVADLSDGNSLDGVIKTITADRGIPDALICCAGMGYGGALEDYAPGELPEELMVNTIGTANIIRSVLPYMRERKAGKIICIGSVAGNVAIPFQSMYSASKAALRSMCDALRLELKGSGVEVCVVSPGDTQTGFTGARRITRGRTAFYRTRCEHAVNTMMHDERNGKSPATVSRSIERLLKKKHMRAQVTVCFSYKLLVLLIKLLPHRVEEELMVLIYFHGKHDEGFRYVPSDQ